LGDELYLAHYHTITCPPDYSAETG